MTVSAGSAADRIAHALHALGVETVFTVASVHNIPMLQALHDRRAVRVVNVRHEQAAVHAADAYARVSGRLGVAVVSTGPGTANAMGGLYEAHFASSPVLVLTGQVPTAFLRRRRGYLHEADEQTTMLRTACREVVLLDSADRAGAEVFRLGMAAQSGRPRPCAVEVPIDLQEATAAPWTPPAPTTARRGCAPEEIAAAYAAVAAARRPLIWAGAGVVRAGATEQLVALAERLRIPVVTSREGRGAIPEDHPLSLGPFPTVGRMRELVESSDLLLAVGTRFQMYATDHWRLRLPDNLIHVDVDPEVIDRSYRARSALIGDARVVLGQLLAEADTAGRQPCPGRDEYLTEAAEAMASARADIEREMGPDYRSICASITAHLPREANIVRDATVPAYVWGDRVLPVRTPGASVRPAAAGIGPGLPFALGAAVANRRPTVLIQGDGGMMLSVGELASIVQADAPVVICAFNDRGYGVLREIIGARGDRAPHDVDLATPDLTMLAQSFGMPSERIADAEAFDRAFARAVERGGPALIEIDMSALRPMQRG